MNNGINNPREEVVQQEQPSYSSTDQTSGREGGDDSLADASPTDPRDDEKVLANNKEYKRE